MTITDEMIEAGCAAIMEKRGYIWPTSCDEEEQRIGRENIRLALTAALSASPAGVGVKDIGRRVHDELAKRDGWARKWDDMSPTQHQAWNDGIMAALEGVDDPPPQTHVLPEWETPKARAAINQLAWSLWKEDQPGTTWTADNREHYLIRAAMLVAQGAVSTPQPNLAAYQERVAAAHHALFHDDPTDIEERRNRFAEEVNETLQAFGMTEDEAIALVRYTWSRPVGQPEKEVGAALLTLASLCVVAGIDMAACGEADLETLQRPETIARIRAKRSTRHGRGPLPGFDPTLATEGK